MRLGKIIKKGYLISTLIPVLLVETALLIVYFVVTSFMSAQHIDMLIDQATEDIHRLLEKQTTVTNNRLQEVSRTLLLLQADHQAYYQTSVQQLRAQSYQEPLMKDENGTYYVEKRHNNCSLYFSPIEAPSNEKLLKVSYSYLLDRMLAKVVADNPLINQAYVNEQYFNRLCPFLDYTPDVFGLHFDISQENFYYLADAQHNPERKHVWTSAYFDPAGMGWMVTVAAPIYYQDTLMAVSGLDITLTTLINEILNVNLAWQTRAFIVDQNYRIIAIGDDVKRDLGLQTVQANGSVVKEGAFEDINLLNDTRGALNDYFQNFAQHTTADNKQRKLYEQLIQLNGESLLMLGSTIAETGWHIVYMTKKEDILASTHELRTFTAKIGIGMVLFLILFYTVFYFIIRIRANRLADKIARPIYYLSEVTTRLGNDYSLDKNAEIKYSNITEIDTLSKNFSDTLKKLSDRTMSLVQMHSERNKYEQISTTDLLTGLFNRRKCYHIFDQEMERLKRNKTPFGLVIIDIDHFKQINDTHGHNAGDVVLKTIAEVLVQQSRKHDSCGRWGGEEFIIICGQAQKDDVRTIAERIRKTTAETDFELGRPVTASFGVTACIVGDTLESAIQRADQALYQAKNNGRNQVVARYN